MFFLYLCFFMLTWNVYDFLRDVFVTKRFGWAMINGLLVVIWIVLTISELKKLGVV